MKKETKKDIVLDILTNHPDGLFSHQVEKAAKEFYMTGETAMRHLRTLRKEGKAYHSKVSGHRDMLWQTIFDKMKTADKRRLITRDPRPHYKADSCITTLNRNLPEGKTCVDCHHFKRCYAAQACEFKDKSCYWMPGRFQPKKTEE